jgi:cyanophycinase
MGFLLLEGGSEFGGRMAVPDRRALERAGGPAARILIFPTAAAPDHNDVRAGLNGVRWFRSLGATQVEALPVIDRASANDASLAGRVRSAQMLYILGGFPGYVCATLRDSAVWRAALQALQAGAVIAGSSAGAMALCEYCYDPGQQKLVEGLKLIGNACVLPHHDRPGRHPDRHRRADRHAQRRTGRRMEHPRRGRGHPVPGGTG